MKKYFLIFLLATIISQAQTYRFDRMVLIESISTKPAFNKFKNLNLMNEDNPNYVLYIVENGAIVRDYESKMIHIFNTEETQMGNYHFDYRYSIRMNGSSKFREELYSIQKLTENEFQISKFKNKRKKKLEYQYTLMLEESQKEFLNISFEKSIKNNNEITRLLKEYLPANKLYEVKSFQFKMENKEGEAKVKRSEDLNLSVEVSNH